MNHVFFVFKAITVFFTNWRYNSNYVWIPLLIRSDTFLPLNSVVFHGFLIIWCNSVVIWEKHYSICRLFFVCLFFKRNCGEQIFSYCFKVCFLFLKKYLGLAHVIDANYLWKRHHLYFVAVKCSTSFLKSVSRLVAWSYVLHSCCIFYILVQEFL